jgi:hypothetical protein
MGLEQTDDHAKPLRGAQGTRPTAPGAGMRARTTLRSGRDLAGPLAPLVTGQSPFAEPRRPCWGGRWSRPGPDEPAPVFVRPALAVEVSFLGWGSGRLRHPAYGGLTRIL